MSDSDAGLEWVGEVARATRNTKLNLDKAPKSKNVQDNTGFTKGQKWLDWFLTNLNPMYAYDKIKNGPTLRQHIDLSKAPKSKNVVDHTNLITNPGWDGHAELFLQALNGYYKDGIRNDGSYTLEDPKRFRKPIFLKR